MLPPFARVPNGPEVEGIPGLKNHLLKQRKSDIAENILRRLLSYGIGRKLTTHDRFVVGELIEDSAVNDYRLLDMIIAICQSRVFSGTAGK